MTAIKLLRYHIARHLQGVHARRLQAVFDLLYALVRDGNLCLTNLGRALPGPVDDKHNIKKTDRLLGNQHLHSELPVFGAAVAHVLLGKICRPVLLVDWTEGGPGREVLSAAVAFRGRALPLYSEVHPATAVNNRQVHDRFLAVLKAVVLPSHCQPIVVTDAGFKNPWFKSVERLGWDYVGRLATTPHAQRLEEEIVGTVENRKWQSAGFLMKGATAEPSDLGRWVVAKTNRLECRLVLYKSLKKGRKGEARPNRKHVHSGSLAWKKAAKRAKTPWLLATSLKDASAVQVVNVYTCRMQIEETFRDTKNHRYGWSLEDVNTRYNERLAVLLMLASLGMIAAHLVGLAAERKGLHLRMQANTTRSRRVLSLFLLGKYVLRRWRWRRRLTRRRLKEALDQTVNIIRGNAPATLALEPI